jgi:uncharacterized protein (DUF488 family)
MILYTIGHSTADLDDFIDVLRKHDVDMLVDVRSKPRSRLPSYDQYPLQTAVEDVRIAYEPFGDRLGGVPRDPAVQARWKQGRLDPLIVAHLRSTDEWADGIDQLRRAVRRHIVCIMCSEYDPDECHRKAVALDVADGLDGIEIRHLAVGRRPPVEVGVQEVLL